jgi:signal peptidase I
LLLFLIVIYYFIGYEKCNYRYQKDILIKILIYSFMFYIITYLIGIYIGFYQTGYSLKFIAIIKNILPVLLTIPLAELIRYIFVTKGSVYKSIIILTLINMVMIDITLLINSYSYSVLQFIITILIPSLAKNILLIYITYKVGYKIPIVYRLIFEIPVFILPIFPAFGLYLNSLIQFLFPLTLTYLIYQDFKKNKKEKVELRPKSRYLQNAVTVFLSILLFIVIGLTTRYFKYYTVTIGSNSMVPFIKKGDVLIVKKLNEKELETLKVKDILVFNHDNIIIVHRIIKILTVNDELYFYTKGDNNNAEDGYPIKEQDVLGKMLIKIPYAGNLTIQLNEMVNKK